MYRRKELIAINYLLKLKNVSYFKKDSVTQSILNLIFTNVLSERFKSTFTDKAYYAECYFKERVFGWNLIKLPMRDNNPTE